MLAFPNGCGSTEVDRRRKQVELGRGVGARKVVEACIREHVNRSRAAGKH